MLRGLLRRMRSRGVGVFGHRGVGGTGIENTLGAFELALDQGANGVELDVRPCRSGELVVLHDPDLLRVAGRPELAEALDLKDFASIVIPGTEERVPSLPQALDLVLGRGAFVNVELKPNVPDLLGACARLHDEIRRRTRAERKRILVSTFSRRALGVLSGLGGLKLGYLFETEVPDEPLPRGIAAVHPRSDYVSEARMREWRKQGLDVNTWTVNDAGEAARVAELGVHAIITDDVPVVMGALGRTRG
jgi:glycerophosphoryl diester phosphodiesterase